MNLPKPNRQGPLGTFYGLFEKYLDAEDCAQFFSNKKQAGRDTYLQTDIYGADKLADVILEEYGVRNKLHGNVIIILPDPGYDIPIFFFQLGGNKQQKFATLDISPVSQHIDYTPLLTVFEKYQQLLDIKPGKIDWVRDICSPYLLQVEYADLDTELFLEAMYEYLHVWIEHYYTGAEKLQSKADIEAATRAIYKFKQVLHENDPAYGIFSKAWGKPVADAFFYLETRHHPALPLPGLTA